MAAMIGHHDAEKAFLESWTSGRLHHASLLAGPQGMGKGAFAARVARFLVTHDRAGEGGAPLSLDDPGDDQAGRLVAAGNHPEIIHLTRQVKDKSKDLARNITIDQVRGMIRRLHLSLSLGAWRVVVIDAVDDLETDGANALLKTLEEPPAQTLFLLVSHSPGRLLPTIRSRCRILRFQPVERDVMTAWLHDLRPMLDMAEVRAIVAASGGVPGKALALSRDCLPEVILGPLPQLYPFIVNDPGEGTQAKRRTSAVILSHLTPPLTRAAIRPCWSRT